ncbi:MAG: hypothetical protein R2823_00140 [Acidimicrobiia bacterium]
MVCHETGGGGSSSTSTTHYGDGLRYLYTTTRAPVGDCYYWSATPGGIDSAFGRNDSAIIAITTTLPMCPPRPSVDPWTVAWEVFRSWDLDPPTPSLQPAAAGITGLPTYLSTPVPDRIEHSERLPDGRTLRVRADVRQLSIAWGDGTTLAYLPSTALPYPEGAVTHTYLLKTCSAHYRANHPSGGLCHPTLDRYPITATFTWEGSYSTGGSWRTLGTLEQSVTVSYDVDEARGVPIP